MSRDDKLVERLKRRPPLADYHDVCRLLELYDWQKRGGGKHTAIYTKGAGRLTIATVQGRTVKRYIVDQVLAALGLDD